MFIARIGSMPVSRFLIQTGFLLLTLSQGFAQLKPIEEIGGLQMNHEHAARPAPESIVRDLRSSNEDVRLKAMAALWVPEALRRASRPEQIELRYAALGSDETKQAVVAVQMGQLAYATVATPKANGWERIAQFNCWCKYDVDHFMDEFVRIVRAPEQNVEHFELVLRASGGGSGLYHQDEVHFRLFRGEMKAVLSFESRLVNYHLGVEKPFLEIQRRWFHPDFERGGFLVEGHANLWPGAFPQFEGSVYEDSTRDLELRHLGNLGCRVFRWNQEAFRYQKTGVSKSCKSVMPNGAFGHGHR